MTTTTTLTQVLDIPDDAPMTIAQDEGSLKVIHNMLSAGVYTNKKRSAFREMMANARDAMRLAGRFHQPVCVKLPTPADPTFVVSDTGVGMTLAEIIENFSYGGSGKRSGTAAELATGELGIGAKSGLAVSDQMTVTSTKDGKCSIVTYYNDASQMKRRRILMRDQPIDHPNGTTISMAVSDPSGWVDEARSVLAWWDDDEYRVVGSDDADEVFRNGLHRYAPTWIDDKFGVANGAYYDHGTTALLVMGQIAYPVKRETLRRHNWGLFTDLNAIMSMTDLVAVARIENKAIKPHPSRESLDLGSTEAMEVVDQALLGCLATLRKYCSDAASRLEPRQLLDTMRSGYSEHYNGRLRLDDVMGLRPREIDITYRGIPLQVDCESTEQYRLYTGKVRTTRAANRSKGQHDMQMSEHINALFIQNVPADRIEQLGSAISGWAQSDAELLELLRSDSTTAGNPDNAYLHVVASSDPAPAWSSILVEQGLVATGAIIDYQDVVDGNASYRKKLRNEPKKQQALEVELRIGQIGGRDTECKAIDLMTHEFDPTLPLYLINDNGLSNHAYQITSTMFSPCKQIIVTNKTKSACNVLAERKIKYHELPHNSHGSISLEALDYDWGFVPTQVRRMTTRQEFGNIEQTLAQVHRLLGPRCAQLKGKAIRAVLEYVIQRLQQTGYPRLGSHLTLEYHHEWRTGYDDASTLSKWLLDRPVLVALASLNDRNRLDDVERDFALTYANGRRKR